MVLHVTDKSRDEILVCDHSFESYWAVLSCSFKLFITLYKVLLTFKSVVETQVCDHSNKSYWADLLHLATSIKILSWVQRLVLDFLSMFWQVNELDFWGFLQIDELTWTNEVALWEKIKANK